MNNTFLTLSINDGPGVDFDTGVEKGGWNRLSIYDRVDIKSEAAISIASFRVEANEGETVKIHLTINGRSAVYDTGEPIAEWREFSVKNRTAAKYDAALAAISFKVKDASNDRAQEPACETDLETILRQLRLHGILLTFFGNDNSTEREVIEDVKGDISPEVAELLFKYGYTSRGMPIDENTRLKVNDAMMESSPNMQDYRDTFDRT